MVNALRRSGLPSPDDRTGELLGALARAGVFRLRACPVAFQCYVDLLGVRLPGPPSAPVTSTQRSSIPYR